MKQIKNSYYSNYGKFEEIVAETGSTVDVENAVVYARNGSKVIARNGSIVRAYYGSTIEARDGSKVIAFEGSTVKACDGSKVRAYRGSTIIKD